MLANSCLFTPAADMEQHSFHFEVCFFHLFFFFVLLRDISGLEVVDECCVRLNQNSKAIKPNQTALTLDAVI